MTGIAGRLLLGLLMVLTFWCRPAHAGTFLAQAAVERTNVFTGEPFIFQIQVSGSDHPEKPDISGIAGFTVEFQGGRQNSSTSLTILNGRVSRDVRQGYIFSYRLTPRHAGLLVIPSIAVHSDGLTVHTQRVEIHVGRPKEVKDFKLRLSLSKTHCYIGEPVILQVTWYLGSDVRNFRFTLPVLEKKALFYFENPKTDTTSGGPYYRIPLGDGEVIGSKGRGSIGGRDYATLTFKKAMFPKKAGDITIDPASVACEVLTGYRRQRDPFGDDFFSDFFKDDFFNMGRQGVYQKVVVPSNTLDLRVSDLPSEGQPATFSGLVGPYHIAATAQPTEISVGDPVTLQIVLSGPDYLEHVTLPPLNQQPALKRDFKIPDERAAGEIAGTAKVFTQTIRPLRPGIREIPAIELSYFDTSAGKYAIARTDPIPLKVKAARVVTARDAEGAVMASSAGSEVQTWSRGIAYNYEDMSVLENQIHDPVTWLKSPWVIASLAIPPSLYLILLSGTILVRRRRADPMASRSRKAWPNLVKALRKAQSADPGGMASEIILNAFRNYLGDKLQIPSAALTFKDVKTPLKEQGVDRDTLDRLEAIFMKCEAGRYAGNQETSDASAMVRESLSLAKDLKRNI
jgi:hypothetical protein